MNLAEVEAENGDRPISHGQGLDLFVWKYLCIAKFLPQCLIFKMG